MSRGRQKFLKLKQHETLTGPPSRKLDLCHSAAWRCYMSSDRKATTEEMEPQQGSSDLVLAERLDVSVSADWQISDPELSRWLEAVRATCERLKVLGTLRLPSPS